jgi:hypothetical protein
MDLVICNDRKPAPDVMERYRQQQAEWVQIDNDDGWWGSRNLALADLIETGGGVARHDPEKLAVLIAEYVLGAECAGQGR